MVVGHAGYQGLYCEADKECIVRDTEKNREQLMEELEVLRKRVKDLEAVESDLQRVAVALRESEERFRFMAETTGDVLYRLKYHSMKYDYLSPSISKLTGYSPQEINDVGFARLVLSIERPGEEKPSTEYLVKNRREGKTGEYLADYLILTKRGDLKWLGDHSFPWVDDCGNLIGSVGILSDITKRKLAEAALLEMNQKLKRLADLDGLTQVANRRRFDEFIRHEWARMRRERTPLSLILCDIDYFKLFNDTYGHLAGDDCLRSVARTIKACANRPADLTARYGGEEFSVVLSNTTAEGAFHVADTIRKRVQELGIAHSGSVCGFLTISCGVSSIIPTGDDTPESLIGLADEGLYRAKAQGRNRVVLEA